MVKVQRPSLKELFDIDLKNLRVSFQNWLKFVLLFLCGCSEIRIVVICLVTLHLFILFFNVFISCPGWEVLHQILFSGEANFLISSSFQILTKAPTGIKISWVESVLNRVDSFFLQPFFSCQIIVKVFQEIENINIF